MRTVVVQAQLQLHVFREVQGTVNGSTVPGTGRKHQLGYSTVHNPTGITAALAYFTRFVGKAGPLNGSTVPVPESDTRRHWHGAETSTGSATGNGTASGTGGGSEAQSSA